MKFRLPYSSAPVPVLMMLVMSTVGLTGSVAPPDAIDMTMPLGSYEGVPMVGKGRHFGDVQLACFALSRVAMYSRDYSPPATCNPSDVVEEVREHGLAVCIDRDCDPTAFSAELTCSDGSLGISKDGTDLACASDAGRYVACVIGPLLPADMESDLNGIYTGSCEPDDAELCETALIDVCGLVPNLVEYAAYHSAQAINDTAPVAADLLDCSPGVGASAAIYRCSGGSTPTPPKTPRPGGTVCEDRESTGAGGAWNLVVPTADLGPSTPPSMAGFASYASLSLQIPDSGTNSQRICYIPGSWSAVTPTRPPPSAAEIAAKEKECNASMFIFAAGAAIAVVGAFKGNPGVVWAGVGVMATGAAMSGACAEAEAMRSDPGYMKCVGHAKVTWGGPGGNSFHHAILSTGLLAVTSHSDGPGYYEENFPPLNQALYDREGYHYGNDTACPGGMEAANQAAWDRFLEYMDTASTSSAATASLNVDAHITGTGAVLDQLFKIAPGVFATSGGNLVFGCSTTVCDVHVTIGVSSCGQQVMAANANQIQYSFAGKAGCASLSLTVNGRPVTMTIPMVRLDGTFGGEGNTIVGGGGAGAILSTV